VDRECSSSCWLSGLARLEIEEGSGGRSGGRGVSRGHASVRTCSRRERERRGQEKEQQAQPFLRAHVMKVAWASKHTLLSGHLGARISVISIDGEKEESFFCLVRDIG
jgi:hypothetical protein